MPVRRPVGQSVAVSETAPWCVDFDIELDYLRGYTSIIVAGPVTPVVFSRSIILYDPVHLGEAVSGSVH